MTVGQLKRILAQCQDEAEVLARLDDEFFDNPFGNVAEILGHEYSYGCTETLALMLECGQPDPELMLERDEAPAGTVNRDEPDESKLPK